MLSFHYVFAGKTASLLDYVTTSQRTLILLDFASDNDMPLYYMLK